MPHIPKSAAAWLQRLSAAPRSIRPPSAARQTAVPRVVNRGMPTRLSRSHLQAGHRPPILSPKPFDVDGWLGRSATPPGQARAIPAAPAAVSAPADIQPAPTENAQERPWARPMLGW